MTPEQLQVLINYIDERAQYEAAYLQEDSEGYHGEYSDKKSLEKALQELRDAFEPTLQVESVI
jgi:hypothetical protein